MKNELLTIGPVTIYGYGLMIAIGALSAYITSEYRAKKRGMNYEIIFNLFIWALVGGMLGAKLLYYITQLKDIIADPSLLLDISQGFVVYGGIIGGIFTGYIFIRKHKLNFLEYFDLVMPSIALAQGFGRLGCVLAGCCYGNETSSSFHIIFHESDFAPNNIPLIPTQPISSALDFLNFFALIFIAKKTKAKGQVAGFYLTFYSAGRFILEFYRGDLERGAIGSLSTSQFIAIFLFLIGIAIIIICGIAARKTASAIAVNESDTAFTDENSLSDNQEVVATEEGTVSQEIEVQLQDVDTSREEE
ncbi:MAG: prolipoprotein diacylglyceryl transferase [Herbinix sp.]|nr:prolipoprotein diacylglyceryl transferase [Herbinix sp.]